MPRIKMAEWYKDRASIHNILLKRQFSQLPAIAIMSQNDTYVLQLSHQVKTVLRLQKNQHKKHFPDWTEQAQWSSDEDLQVFFILLLNSVTIEGTCVSSKLSLLLTMVCANRPWIQPKHTEYPKLTACIHWIMKYLCCSNLKIHNSVTVQATAFLKL